MSVSNNFPTIKPSLNLDFANTGTLDPRVTFARASTATYYDGVTTAKAEENLLKYSQEFDNAAWLTDNSGVTANSTAAPDGTSTAETLTDNATSGAHGIHQTSLAIAASTIYACSVFVKSNTHDFVQFMLRDGLVADRYITAIANLSTGAITQTASGTSGTLISSAIAAAGNNWYRIQIVGSLSAVSNSSSMQLCIRFAPAASGNTVSGFGTISYAGSGTSFYAWGAQLEQRSAVSSYTATTTQPITNYIPVLQTAASGVARFDHNPTTSEALGLLIEEQRTNLLTYSSDFSNAAWGKTRTSITADTIVAPDGTLTGDKLVEDTSATSTHICTQGVTYTNGTTYTFSVYAKAAERTQIRLRASTQATFPGEATFDLSTGVVVSTTNGTSAITSVGDGWYRCSVAAAATATGSTGTGVYIFASSINYTGDGYSGVYIWNAQCEVGAFPTSAIQTTSAQVTRQADAASMTGTNFSSWYNQGEGTFYSEFMRNTTANAIAGGGNTVPRIYSLGTSASGSLQLRLFSSTGAEATGPSMYIANTWAANQYNKHALAFEVNDAALVRDGGSVVSDSTVTALTADTLAIGQNTIGSGNIGQGWIRKLSYYPQRLTDAQLQALTS